MASLFSSRVALLAWACAGLLACSSSDKPVSSGPNDSDDEKESDSTGGKGGGKGTGVDAGASARKDASKDAVPDAKAGSTTPPNNQPPEGKPDDGKEQCASIRKDAPAAQATPVDVVFVIDTSGSMSDEAAKVKENLNAFVAQFDDSTADTHVVMVTQPDPAAGSPLASDRKRYRFVPTQVDSRALYTVSLLTFPVYGDVLRKNAVTHFVMVTDDNDSMAPAAFKVQMEGLLGHSFTLHSVASENNNGGPCKPPGGCNNPLTFLCGATAIGSNYNSLAAETGGESISICTDDWTEVFGRLKAAVVDAVPLPCDYPLADATSDDFDKTKVQIVYTPEGGAEGQFPKATSRDQCGDKTGWFYDDEAKPTSITLCPVACEQVSKGGAMDIAFGCEPDPILL